METNPYATPKAAPFKETDSIAQQLEGIQYPLSLSFKILALTNKATITDATGRTVLFTKQKLFKFREHVEIFTDNTMTTKLADIRTQKVIDWSARYFFKDGEGSEIGSVGRKGWKSLWKAHYNTFNPGDNDPDFSIREENPMAKIFDALLGEVPILGIFCGFFFNPRYIAKHSDGADAMRFTKGRSFLESKFKIDKLSDKLTSREELNLFLSLMMLAMLERRRG